MNSRRLVELINSTYRSNNHIKHFTELIKLFPLLYTFWTKVTIDSHDTCLKEAIVCENNMILFCKHGKKAIFTNACVRDREKIFSLC